MPFRNRYSSSESASGEDTIMLMHNQGSTPEGLPSNLADSDYAVTPCDDGSYCCGSGPLAESCCKGNQGHFLKGGRAVSRNSSSFVSGIASSSSVKATPSSSSRAALTPTPSASPSSAAKASHQTGLILGAALGGAAVLALITGLIVLIGIRHLQHKSGSQEVPQVIWKDQRNQDDGTHRAGINDASCELAAVGPVLELETSTPFRRP